MWLKYTDDGQKLICVPDRQTKIVFEAYHNLFHPCKLASLRLIGSRFYWPKIRIDVARYCRECIDCQKNKSSKLPILPTKSFMTRDLEQYILI